MLNKVLVVDSPEVIATTPDLSLWMSMLSMRSCKPIKVRVRVCNHPAKVKEEQNHEKDALTAATLHTMLVTVLKERANPVESMAKATTNTLKEVNPRSLHNIMAVK